MKKVILILTLITSFSFSDSTEYVSFLSNNVEKPILVMIKQNNCRFCEKQLKVINNSVLREYIDRNFQFTTINRSNDMIPAELMDGNLSPTMFVLSKKGKVVDKLVGLQKSKVLLRRLNIDLYRAQ